MTRICSIKGCDSKHRTLGYCARHYKAIYYSNAVNKLRRLFYLRVYMWWPENKKNGLEQSRSSSAKERFKLYQRKRRMMPSVKLKNEARWAVCAAVREGRLVRKPCEVCGVNKVQAHHDSYMKEDWLKVRWLCSTDHARWHKVNTAKIPSESEILAHLKSSN